MKYKSVAQKGAFTHILAANAKINIQATNHGVANADFAVLLLDENDTEQAIIKKESIAPNSAVSVDFIAQQAQKIKIVATDDIHTIINKVEEVSIGGAKVAQSAKSYVSDGVNSTYEIGENAPVNSHLDLVVSVDKIYTAKFGEDYALSDDKKRVVFIRQPYAGADIEIKATTL